MLLSEFIKSLKGCRHSKVKVNTNGAYCPDCGQYIIIKWYLVKCSCCGIKRTALIDFNDNIKPVDKFCPNCGCTHTYIEEIEKINFVDINFAVHKKEIVENASTKSSTQIWVEEDVQQEQTLIGLNPS